MKRRYNDVIVLAVRRFSITVSIYVNAGFLAAAHVSSSA